MHLYLLLIMPYVETKWILLKLSRFLSGIVFSKSNKVQYASYFCLLDMALVIVWGFSLELFNVCQIHRTRATSLLPS